MRKVPRGFLTITLGVVTRGALPQAAHLGMNCCPISADQEIVWRCRHCSQGISLEAATSSGQARIRRDRRRHKKEARPNLSWKQWHRSDYSYRTLSTTATKFKATAAKHPHLVGFRTFRWLLVERIRELPGSSVAGSVRHAIPLSLEGTRCPLTMGKSRAAERLQILPQVEGVH